MSKEKFTLADRLNVKQSSIWQMKTGFPADCVNLVLGMPDFMPPREFVHCLRDAVMADDVSTHQYSNSSGDSRLLTALAKMYSPCFGRDLDIKTEIMVALGAKEALTCVLHGILHAGDEVILIEPFFTPYYSSILAAGGVCVSIPLRRQKQDDVTASSSSNDWTLSREELASKFSPRTKVFILNTPNNPLGKIYNRDELTMIADLCKKHDVVCLADEVYEWLVFDGGSCTKIATLPGMWERTITVSNIGKMLSVTGWRTGWAIGPAHLMRLAIAAHVAGSVVTPTPMQLGVARCLELELSREGTPQSYRTSFAVEVQDNRDKLAQALASAGLRPIIPQGGYFLVVDASAVANKLALEGKPAEENDIIDFLAKEKNLLALPLSEHYTKQFSYMGKFYLRLCMVKDKKTIAKAVEIIQNLGI